MYQHKRRFFHNLLENNDYKYKKYPKSILKKNNYRNNKRVFFNDNRNEIREYFLSSEEKRDKHLAYKKIKKRNKV